MITLKERREAEVKAARAIAMRAKNTNRDLTASEVRQIEEHLAKADRLDAQAKGDARFNGDAIAQLNSMKSPPKPIFSEEQAESLVRTFKSGTPSKMEVDPAGLKAPVLVGTSITSTDSEPVVAPMPEAVVALADLFGPPKAVDGPTVRIYTVDAPDPNGVGPVGEGELKPDAAVSWSYVDAPLVKLATVFKNSDEMAEDAAFLVQQIQQQIVKSVLVEENKLVVSAWDSAAGTQQVTSPNLIDGSAMMIAQIEAATGITPTTLVVNPVDLAGIRQAKATTAGTYYTDPFSDTPSGLHGLKLASTASVAAGTAWVVSAGFGRFYRRGPLRVETGFVDDDFQKNLVTTRVEERVLAGVTTPSLLGKVTIG